VEINREEATQEFFSVEELALAEAESGILHRDVSLDAVARRRKRPEDMTKETRKEGLMQFYTPRDELKVIEIRRRQ
jgi:hypothetical protein